MGLNLRYIARESQTLNEKLRDNDLGNAYYTVNTNSSVFTDPSLSQAGAVIQANTAMPIKSVYKDGKNIIYEVDIQGTSFYIKGGTYTVDSNGILDSNLYSSGDVRYVNPSGYSGSELIDKSNVNIPTVDEEGRILDMDGNALNGQGINTNQQDTVNQQEQYYPGIGQNKGINAHPAWFTNVSDHLGQEERARFQQANNFWAGYGVNYSIFRNIFGMPYQFLPTTDARIVQATGAFRKDNEEENALEFAGYEFTEKILSRMPLLYITPGNTSFMGQGSKAYNSTLIGNFMQAVGGLVDSSLSEMLDNYSGKLYTITPAYSEYFNYVNPMCRAGAIFLGLVGNKDESKNYKLDGVSVDQYHWGWNKNTIASNTGSGYDDFNFSGFVDSLFKRDDDADGLFKMGNRENHSALKDLMSAVYYRDCIPFYINSDATFQDSFSNEVADSSLATTVNALSDRAREVQFLLGTATSAVGDAFDRVNMDSELSDIKAQIESITSKISGGNSIFSTIANSVKTIVSGGRILFPQIWTNSNFTKSYSITIKLTTPSVDKFSWWLNIYVPLCHLMALVLPRSEYVNSYTTPFLVKAFYKGMFNIDMGIITEMSFSKGKDGSWTKDCLPTVVDVSFTMQDLYSAMGMTSTGSMFKGFTLQNVAEMDYIANLCGININEPDIFRMIRLWATFNIKNQIMDFLPNLSLNIDATIRGNIISQYNNFWGL